MKKLSIWAVFLLITGLLITVGFNSTRVIAGSGAGSRIDVVTSLPMIKNIFDKIGGDQVKAESIIHGPGCDHEYEAGANDMKTLAKCGIFAKIGMGSDPWADKLTGITGKNTLVLDCSKGAKTVKVLGRVNPHYWGNPENVKVIAKNVLDSLVQIKPGSKPYFTTNYNRFLQEIDRTGAELRDKVAALQNKQIVSYSNAFPYFFEYLGFQNLMTVELSCEQQVSPKAIAAAVKLIKTKQIKILVGDAAEPKEPEGIARETGAKLVLLWPVTDQSNDYLMTFRNNVDLLEAALK
jgi:zinc transport system substrate-binding protein